jgi:hypothetical protein
MIDNACGGTSDQVIADVEALTSCLMGERALGILGNGCRADWTRIDRGEKVIVSLSHVFENCV